MWKPQPGQHFIDISKIKLTHNRKKSLTNEKMGLLQCHPGIHEDKDYYSLISNKFY